MAKSEDDSVGSCTDETDLLWDNVSERIQQFIDAWESSDEPPAIEAHLPARGSAAWMFTLVELVKIDLEQRWARHQPRTIRDYIRDFPELEAGDGLPLDLLYEEFHIRQQSGETLKLEDYLREFPDQAEELERMLAAEHPFESTSVFHKSRPVALEPGDQIDDFDLVARLGEGAFASVFLARQQSMQRIVALKVSADRGREPQTLARLDHPHIVRIFDQRLLPAQKLRLLYMQYVPGGSLWGVLNYLRQIPRELWSGAELVEAVDRQLTQRGIEIPHDSHQRQRLARSTWPQAVCLLGAQLADALDYAHRQGVLHRDLKPANILLSETVTPKVVDFNISSCTKVQGASANSYFGGSLGYMSPEQMEACNPRHERNPESLDGRSDIFSLGVVLWELLAGSRPFDDVPLSAGWSATLDAMTQIRRAGLGQEAWQQLPPDCPPGIPETLKRCLAVSPDDRFATAQQAADQLRLALNRAAYRIFSRPAKGIRAWSGRCPILVMVLSVLVPNALAGWFNYDYNHEGIIRPLANAEQAFQQVAILINGIAFPLGLVIGLWIAWPVAVAVRQRHRLAAQQIAPRPIRQLALRLGHYMAMLGISLWFIAGFAFPLAMFLFGKPLSGLDAVHFFGSLVLCGLIGAAYPFFGATAIVVDVWYAALLKPEIHAAEDEPVLDWLERVCSRYLVLAGSVPLVSLGILSSWGRIENRLALIVLSVGGFLLFALVFRLWRLIQSDLQTLRSTRTEQII